jgi:hypothetical protein
MFDDLKVLLRGDAPQMVSWLAKPKLYRLLGYLVVILAGSGVYGFTLGIWRAPLQSLYTAIKFPLVIFLTCAGNALINGMLAQLLGSGLSFRQTSVAILISFSIATTVLAGFSPITLFIWFNAPLLGSTTAILGHSTMLLAHVCAIALAGVLANRRAVSFAPPSNRPRHDGAYSPVQLAGWQSLPRRPTRLDPASLRRLSPTRRTISSRRSVTRQLLRSSLARVSAPLFLSQK